MSDVFYSKNFVFLLLLSLIYCSNSENESNSNSKQNGVVEIAEDYKIVTATSTIFIAGLGDRSFLITTLMATKYNKLVILLSALVAMGLMSILSVILGENLPTYISYQTINYIAILIFIVLGLKMLHEGVNMKEEQPVQEEKKGRHKNK